MPVHAWAYCEEVESLWRNELSRRLFAKRFPRVDEESNLRFRGRIWPFMVRNLSGRQVVVRSHLKNSPSYPLGLTQANGHIEADLVIDDADFDTSNKQHPSALTVRAELPKKQKRQFTASCYLVPPEGVSIISDIDDTIKVTKATIKAELFAHTFYLPFKPISGMANAYSRWAKQGASFHYVSGTPYQLGPTLIAFFKQHRFPQGSVHLRSIRFRDKSFFNLFADPLDYKLPAVERLLQQYPQRQFVLIGDLGEKDAEIYARMAERYPQQIQQIWLRQLEDKPSQENQQRLQAIFQNLPDELWHTFRTGDELPRQL